jgi:hypothetical protein
LHQHGGHQPEIASGNESFAIEIRFLVSNQCGSGTGGAPDLLGLKPAIFRIKNMGITFSSLEKELKCL